VTNVNRSTCFGAGAVGCASADQCNGRAWTYAGSCPNSGCGRCDTAGTCTNTVGSTNRQTSSLCQAGTFTPVATCPTPNPAALGSCCYADGTCLITNQSACPADIRISSLPHPSQPATVDARRHLRRQLRRMSKRWYRLHQHFASPLRLQPGHLHPWPRLCGRCSTNARPACAAIWQPISSAVSLKAPRPALPTAETSHQVRRLPALRESFSLSLFQPLHCASTPAAVRHLALPRLEPAATPFSSARQSKAVIS
jgi:hypothetical protein